jgi:hypothetical protein
VRVAEGCRLLVGAREAEPTGIQARPQQLFQPGLEKRQRSCVQPVDPDRVHVQAEYVETEFGKACCLRRAQVSGSEHCDAADHGISFLDQSCALPAAGALTRPFGGTFYRGA